ncbi:MAG: hypothetical protein LM582_09220 [Desulfurococcaceae archaeon]|nr:hypothetical protein [Desulfurococcaceae archaeon]MCC6057634.1 hypothetical protein [Desulfurococcaceae archaeon]
MNSKEEYVSGWLLRCIVCGYAWILEVSFDIRDAKKIYHYCHKCKRNTFHEVLARVEKPR